MIVEVEGQEIEFPDSMTPDEVKAVLRSKFPPKQAAAPQSRGTIADAAGQGLTLGFADELSGLVGAIPAALSTGNNVVDAYKGIRDAARENYAGYKAENPGTALAAEIGGGLLTGGVGGGRALAGTAGRQMLGRAALSGAALGGASGAGYSQADTVGGLATDTALGAAVGGAAGAAFPAAGQALNAVGRRTASMADDLGLRLTPGHRFNSPTLKRVEASLESFPLTSPAFTKLREQNQGLLNRTAAKSIGLDADNLAGDALGVAKANIGKEFERLTQGRTITVDAQFQKDLGDILKDLDTPLQSAKKGKKVLEAISKVVASGTIDDRTYQDISSEVTDSLMKKAAKGKTRKALIAAKDKIDELFERNLGTDELNAFRDTRSKWRNLISLKKSVNVGTGDVKGGLLANRLASNDEAGYVFGGNTSPLYQAARAAQKYQDIVGNSGTADRMAIPMMLNALAGSGLGAAGSAATGNDPMQGAMYGAAGLIGLPMLTKAYLTGGRPVSGALLNRVGASPAALAGLLGSDR